jgi:hypothetical protein
MPEPTADKAQLSYAPAPARRGRRIRRAILAILLLSALAAAFIWRAPLWSHAQVIWWQRAAASFTLPADTIVATTDRSATAPKIPDAWLRYESFAPTPLPGGGNLPKTIAFLHARQSPAGHQRIVAIRCIPIYLASASILQSLQSIVIQPASFWRLQSLPRFTPGPSRGGYPVFMPINLYAGQIDPGDDSHFTLAYTINGKPGTIDGRLGDDDTVKLELRPGSPSVISELHPATQSGVKG